MIFLKEKNLLFFKAHKVAGTSVEIALSVHATDQDIVTPIGTPDEINRLNWTGVTPRNWAISKDIEEEYNAENAALLQKHLSGAEDAEELTRQLLKKFKTYYRKQARYYNHITPAALEANGHLSTYKSATKVTITRHPYEQLISQAFFRAKQKEPNNKNRDTNSYIDFLLKRPSKNESYYVQDGKALCDVFIRYEHLEEDLKKLEDTFDLAILEHLPKTKHLYRTDHRPAGDILSAAQKQQCYARCQQEFEFFNYDI